MPESGIYRDDGLAVGNRTGPQWSRVEKDVRKLFKEN